MKINNERAEERTSYWKNVWKLRRENVKEGKGGHGDSKNERGKERNKNEGIKLKINIELVKKKKAEGLKEWREGRWERKIRKKGGWDREEGKK